MTLYLGNLTGSINKVSLEDEFSKFGKCEVNFCVNLK